MKLILSPKGNVGKMVLENVRCFCDEAETLLVVFEDGRTRNYPLMHLWYWESHVDDHRVSPTRVRLHGSGTKLADPSMGGAYVRSCDEGKEERHL